MCAVWWDPSYRESNKKGRAVYRGECSLLVLDLVSVCVLSGGKIPTEIPTRENALSAGSECSLLVLDFVSVCVLSGGTLPTEVSTRENALSAEVSILC